MEGYTVTPAIQGNQSSTRLPKFNPDEEEAFMSWYGNSYKSKGWPSSPGAAPVDPRKAFQDEQSADLGEPGTPSGNATAAPGWTITPKADETPGQWSVTSPKGSQGPQTTKGLGARVNETYQSYRPNWSDTDFSGVGNNSILGNVLGEVAAPLATLRDYVQGVAIGTPGEPAGPKAMGDIFQKERGVPSTDWKQNIVPGIVEGLDELALPWLPGRRPPNRVPSQGRPTLDVTSAPVEVPRPPERTGMYSGDHQGRLTPAAPEEIPRAVLQGLRPDPLATRQGTGRYVLQATGQEPTIQDLARQHPAQYGSPSAEGFQSARPFVYPDETISRDALGSPGIPVQGSLDTFSHVKDPTLVFETPGFLRTGEEMVAGRQPVPESVGLHGHADTTIREAQDILVPQVSPVASQGAAEGAYRAQQALRLRENRIQNRLEKENLDFAEQYVTERLKAAKSARLPKETPQLLDQPAQAGLRSIEELSPSGVPQHSQPGNWQKAFLHAFDVLDTLGPVSRNVSSILRYTYDYSEQGTRQNFLDATKLLAARWGERSNVKSFQTAPTLREAMNASVHDFGMTRQESDAVVELLHAGLDDSKISEKARATLPVSDPRVRAFAQDFWQVATGRASSHPSIQGKAKVFDPITGEQFPVGETGPYWPHQATGGDTKVILSNEFLKGLYERGRYNEKGIDFELFKTKFSDWWKSDNPDVRLRKFAGIEYKRFLDITADANSHGRTAADSLRHYGYETDPLRMLVKHNMYALKRAATLEHESTLKMSMSQLGNEYGIDSPAYKWIENVLNRAQGVSQREDFISKTGSAWSIAQSIAYPAFLRGSWKQNIALQPNYLVMQTGLKDTTKAIWNYFGQKLGYTPEKIVEMSERSGSVFPAFMSKYHAPEGLAQQYAKSMMEWNLFSPSDMATRRLSGMAGLPYTDRIAKEFWKNPADQKWNGLLRELHINPEELYKDLAKVPKEQWENGLPVVPDKYLMRGAQVIANKSMGRTGIQSMQSWAAGDTELHKVMLMLHRQIASNEGLMVNSILRAPTAGIGIKRALTMLVGAEAAGLMYNGIVNELTGNDFFDVNKSLVKTMGGNKEAALFAKSLLMGIGTFTSGVVLMGLNSMGGNVASPVYAFMSPPIASLADELINKGLRGDIPGVVKRLLPSEILSTTLTRNEKEEKQRKRGSTGFPDPLRIP